MSLRSRDHRLTSLGCAFVQKFADSVVSALSRGDLSVDSLPSAAFEALLLALVEFWESEDARRLATALRMTLCVALVVQVSVVVSSTTGTPMEEKVLGRQMLVQGQESRFRGLR